MRFATSSKVRDETPLAQRVTEFVEQFRPARWYQFKNVETDSVDRLAMSLTTGSKNPGHFGRLLLRRIPHRYLILLSGEVAEWSKAPDC